MARLVVLAMVFVLFSAASAAAGELGLITLLEKEKPAIRREGGGPAISAFAAEKEILAISGLPKRARDSVIGIEVSLKGNSLTEENDQPVWSTTWAQEWSWRVEQLTYYYDACDGECPYYFITGSLFDGDEWVASAYLYYYVNSGQTDFSIMFPFSDNSLPYINAELLVFQSQACGFFKGRVSQYDENGYIIAISEVSGGDITIKWYYSNK